MGINRRTVLQAAVVSPFLFSVGSSRGQELLPTSRTVVGFPPGGATDVAARWLAEKLTGTLARTAIVENKPGAAGRIAVDTIKAASGDGSLILLTPSSVLALYPHIYRNLSYNPFTDLIPLSSVAEFVHGLAIGPAVPESVKTLKGFVDWCKANPSKANCANPGEGSSPHFLTTILSRASGTPIQPVAYKGTGPALNDLLGGQIAALMSQAEGQYMNFQKTGRLRILATSGPERSRFFPEVPTFKEEGYDQIVLKEWLGLFIPARSSAQAIATANAAVVAALTQKDVVDKFAAYAMVAGPSSPEALEKALRSDFEFWGAVVKSSGFKPM